jgi:hypothetical protein
MARAARPVILRQLLASVASVALIAGHTGTGIDTDTDTDTDRDTDTAHRSLRWRRSTDRHADPPH